MGTELDRSQPVQVAQNPSESAEWRPTPDQIREAQIGLKALGFDPGPPDGALGPRTVTALKAYQQSANEKADGRLTRELYERLTGAAHQADSPSASANRTNLTDQRTDCLLDPSGVWRFEDALGSSFTLTLKTDGTVSGPSYPSHWRWQPTGQGIEINYDNGMGLTVTRSGRLKRNALLVGEATDSRGRSWTWTAERMKAASDGDSGGCQPPPSND